MSQLKLLLVLLIFLISFKSYSQPSLFNQQMQVGFEEKQGKDADLSVKLVNEAGDTLLLKDYQCPGTCSPLMWGVSKFIDDVDLQPGKDYQVITISFDPSEKIDLGIKKKASYISTMKKKDSVNGWLFFVSDSLNIAKLTQSVGFNYKKINNQYVHPTGLIALASDGKIVRYLRGIDFLPFDIKITMVEAAKGKIGPSINRLLAICYSYDDQGNKFVFNVTRVSAIVILFFVIIIFLVLAFSRVIFKKTVSK
jgi:protein SCO1/2